MALAPRAAKAGDTLRRRRRRAARRPSPSCATRAEPLGIEVVDSHDLDASRCPTGDVFGVLLQYPGASGAVRDLAPLVDAAHERGALVTVAADLLALTLLRAAGRARRRHRRRHAQRFGVPMGFGGPHAGYMAVRERAGAPAARPAGRGVASTPTAQPAYRLALQTREQHIRREKATSNICTAQVLLAVIAGMYAVYHGPDGLQRIARRVAPHGGDPGGRAARGRRRGRQRRRSSTP